MGDNTPVRYCLRPQRYVKVSQTQCQCSCNPASRFVLLVLTSNSVLCDVVIHMHDVTARLKGASIGIKVEMSHRLLDANTETHVLFSECMNCVYEVCIIWR